MKWLKINNREWNVSVLAISENFNILYSENTGRTLANGARMSLDPIGTFYGHKITVARKRGEINEFDELFDFISQPRYDGIWVEAVHGQSTIRYEAYISNGQREVVRIDEQNEVVYYDSFDINIVPMEAQVLP